MQPRPSNIYDTVAREIDPAVLNQAPITPGGRPPYDAAMRIASPVGDGYPQVDWAEAAAMPVRVLPPWMLAVLFVVALGVALGLTFAVAALIR
jgi:hypothetical protein